MADVAMPDADAEFGDDNATSAAVPKGASGKAKAKAKGKGRAKAQAAAGKCESSTSAAACARRQPVTSCICPGCPFPKYQGSRFCSEADHKKAWDNMVYQRRTRKNISEEEKKNFDESMKDDGIAGKAVLDFSRDNPPEMRKKGLVDFTRFERSKGHRISTRTTSALVPMTERAFFKHCENILGLTPEESEEFWKEFYADKSLQRDQKGFRGAERLWLPLNELKSKEREHYTDNKVVEGCGDIKNPSLKDRQVLEEWVFSMRQMRQLNWHLAASGIALIFQFFMI